MDNRKTDCAGLTLPDLRPWDLNLLQRYPPRYHMVNRSCSLCALGPCDLEKGRKGNCGQKQETFLAREALLLAATGAAAHTAHARDVVERLISEHGEDLPLDLGDWVQILMPITQILTGLRPETLGQLLPVLGYIDSQIVRMLSAAHFGGESSSVDIESKVLHAGTMDILAMEVAETAQTSGYGFAKGESGARLVQTGADTLSDNKPVILCIGHHSDVGQRVMNKVDAAGLDQDIEIAGLCCTAHDMARGSGKAYMPKIAGNLRDQLSFIRSGRADIVITDQQCIRLDLLSETLSTGAFFLATSDQACAGLPDETAKDTEQLSAELFERQLRGVFISDPGKSSDLAIALARRLTLVSRPVKKTKQGAPGLKGWMRTGRGAIDDYEIKATGPSLVLGDIPGVIAFLTCPEYPDSRDSVSWMAGILAERGYIVMAAGCAAMDLGLGSDNTVYHRFHGRFDGGSIINTGSCVSSANAIGALIKVASIFLHRRLDKNYIEIADYILNRIGAVGMMWGGITPKSFAASAGANRLGIPVVFGSQGYKFRRTLDRKSTICGVFDARSGELMGNGVIPAHLSVVAATKEEALIQAVRLCFRPNDTTSGRRTKLRNYMELSQDLLDKTPDDISDLVRVHEDIPEEFRDVLIKTLDKTGWQPSFIPDPTLLQSLVRHG